MIDARTILLPFSRIAAPVAAALLSSLVAAPEIHANDSAQPVGRLTSAYAAAAACERRRACPELGGSPAPATGPYRVAVIGSGLSGCIAAMLIRRRWREGRGLDGGMGDDCDGPPSPPLDLRVYERATYPAGRFGAEARYGGAVADLGAQVLSTVNPADPRARGGHGVSPRDLRLADGIGAGLREKGLIRRVDDGKLCATEERMVWEGLWAHHVAPGGMGGVLRHFLAVAGVEPRFGARIDAVRPGERDGSVRIEGVQRRRTGRFNNEIVTAAISDEVDCVVVCIPAPDALAIEGVVESLPKESQIVLRGVRYDSRVVEAHFFHPRLRSSLSAAFGTRIELDVEDDGMGLHLISLQDFKRLDTLNDDINEDYPCAIVAHGVANARDIPAGAVDEVLARLLKVDGREIVANRLRVKRINWTPISQMIMPMEAVVSNPPTNPLFQCLRGKIRLDTHGTDRTREDNDVNNLFVAGDFMTQSSFLGCVASADAAARAIVSSARNCDPKRVANPKSHQES